MKYESGHRLTTTHYYGLPTYKQDYLLMALAC